MYVEKVKNVATPRLSKKELLNDYYIAYLSRQLSLMGRREVHNGRAHFGIFGDGKEVAQVALAKTFRKGDWRSGYYRDQTFMLALGLLEPEEFFAMIYGDTDVSFNPSTGGRNFNNHYCTRNIDADGKIDNTLQRYNSASDISSTAGQMPRLLGLAQASKLARDDARLRKANAGNVSGNEVAFGSIGDASTSEGMFFETINAAAVMQVPLAVTVYDDGYGISVPIELQTAKSSISKALKGFEKTKEDQGILIYHCHGWDYATMVESFAEGIDRCRKEHVPVLFHIDELTQPTGHSTSGSHERYKSAERLEWEAEMDGIVQFRKWLIVYNKATLNEIEEVEKEAKNRARSARDKAWKNYTSSFKNERDQLAKLVAAFDQQLETGGAKMEELQQIDEKIFPTRRAFLSFAKRLVYELHRDKKAPEIKAALKDWVEAFEERSSRFYNMQLHRELKDAATKVKAVEPVYSNESSEVNGSDVINYNFHELFKRHPRLITFGEDTGKLGDVNQGMKGMQEKFGEQRVFDTGIRETTIIGQGIGLALRGFRPIAEIQYLDYLIYAQSTLSDDLATMQYRTMGKQAAPVIVRTRGHQLQGIWHAGSPMQLLLGSLRGMYLCVPRDMTRAAGFYNTLLEANDPALVIEPLKGYNVKEKLPENLGGFRVPLGVPEVLVEGSDITIVTYGWNVHHVEKAAQLLAEYDISAEVIDVQTLMPFDLPQLIKKSVMKTNKVLFVDEDVPGGATAYMLQKALDEQKIFNYLDTAPRTLPAMEHRPAYGIDGEYFSKPNVERIFETVYGMMHDTDVKAFPSIF
ncbi:alpha-ketoacid dehydrogenase subunit alpha/beta [Roseimarinus sediminis]|uniref:alpha-ketoacid dehydrogenase subunit alpha/beta n=1 Tax=Roseimarinus sediminis TaxID=1610899 RepID=UPI003D2204E4